MEQLDPAISCVAVEPQLLLGIAEREVVVLERGDEIDLVLHRELDGALRLPEIAGEEPAVLHVGKVADVHPRRGHPPLGLSQGVHESHRGVQRTFRAGAAEHRDLSALAKPAVDHVVLSRPAITSKEGPIVGREDRDHLVGHGLRLPAADSDDSHVVRRRLPDRQLDARDRGNAIPEMARCHSLLRRRVLGYQNRDSPCPVSDQRHVARPRLYELRRGDDVARAARNGFRQCRSPNC